MHELDALGHRYATDKASPPPARNHDYLDIYEQHFAPVRAATRAVLEIGVGLGGSLKMWAEYFREARIYGLDDFSEVPELPASDYVGRVYRGNQANREDLNDMITAFGGPLDVVIDDGGHTMRQQQISLGLLFPHLSPGGLYVIEDLWTSSHRKLPGRPDGFFNPTETLWTTLKLLQCMRDGLPWESDFMLDYEARYIRSHIESVVIEKGVHSEIAFIRKK